jgi:stringent starvation protein B
VVHPVQSVIESLYAAGRCPRLHVNATFEGVVCPDFIREQWKERLIIDLDPSYPLDLIFEEDCLAADLSFGGYVTRCTFPYGAVYVVADRSTGRGIVLDQNMPESVKRSRYGKSAAGLQPSRPNLRSVDAKDDPGLENGQTAEAAEATDAPDADAAATDEEQVQKRRAAFKVIDGGS